MDLLHCEWLFTGEVLLRDHTVVRDVHGIVQEVIPGRVEGAARKEGLVGPAFVNAHCHLELSHLKGMLPRHTGMAGFVKALQAIRDQPSEEERVAAMHAALDEMRAGGIAAIGDICNGLNSLAVKQERTEFAFHNFLEQFGLNPGMAEEIFHRGLDQMRAYNRHCSITPHAPYSMSVALRDKLYQYAERREWPLSIHLLESLEERQLFEDLDGPLMEFIRGIGAVFQAHTYPTALAFVTDGLPRNCNLLLVHATEMEAGELDALMVGWPRARVVLCPLANAYIHDRQPDGAMFARYADRICLGTDSLAGNDRLSIWAEARHLQANQGLETALLLRWATVNGAAGLGLPMQRYQVAKGSAPRLIHVSEFSGSLAGSPIDPMIQFIDP